MTLLANPAASAPQATEASGPAATQASAPHALVLGSDATDVGFPWAGAGLLAVLVVVAVLARWRASAGSGSLPAGLQRWLGGRPGLASASPSVTLAVESSMRLDAQTQLHVVAWEGRRLLVATSGHASPVVLDRHSAEPADDRGPA